jgi:thiol-disulfide isomerase/thioredoxin|tara:strand:- start:4302 stop:4718 length:417 start_codon:yes stop_codon:yes gene_type:complete
VFIKRVLLIFLLFFSLQAHALQLLFVSTDWCPVCQQADNEIAQTYQSTDLPLIKIDITSGVIENKDYANAYRNGIIGRLYGVPTFIIWDEVNKREIVRWVGYRGEEDWYEMLERVKIVAINNIEKCKNFNICVSSNIQ